MMILASFNGVIHAFDATSELHGAERRLYDLLIDDEIAHGTSYDVVVAAAEATDRTPNDYKRRIASAGRKAIVDVDAEPGPRSVRARWA